MLLICLCAPAPAAGSSIAICVGHATAVIQDFRDPAGGLHHSLCDFVAYDPTVPAFRATYVPTPLVKIAGLQLRSGILCRAPLVKKARGRLKSPVLLLKSREHNLVLSMWPYRIFRTAYTAAPATTKDTISCVVELSL